MGAQFVGRVSHHLPVHALGQFVGRVTGLFESDGDLANSLAVLLKKAATQLKLNSLGVLLRQSTFDTWPIRWSCSYFEELRSLATAVAVARIVKRI